MSRDTTARMPDRDERRHAPDARDTGSTRAAGRARIHAAIAAAACVALPAASWVDGSGQLAWSMFCKTGLYRLQLVAAGHDGARRVVDPTQLAVAAGHAPAASFLAGAAQWRHHDIGRVTLDRHLDDVAALACRALRATSIDLTLSERRDLDAPVATRARHVRCPR